jgi:hypothetical protein
MFLFWKIVKPSNECRLDRRNFRRTGVRGTSTLHIFILFWKVVELIDLIDKLVEIFSTVGGLV